MGKKITHVFWKVKKENEVVSEKNGLIGIKKPCTAGILTSCAWHRKMHLTGVEPAHMPPEGTALSIELQMHPVHYILEVLKMQAPFFTVLRQFCGTAARL